MFWCWIWLEILKRHGLQISGFGWVHKIDLGSIQWLAIGLCWSWCFWKCLGTASVWFYGWFDDLNGVGSINCIDWVALLINHAPEADTLSPFNVQVISIKCAGGMPCWDTHGRWLCGPWLKFIRWVLSDMQYALVDWAAWGVLRSDKMFLSVNVGIWKGQDGFEFC